mmetsp:Transcript_8901/g.15668  ORF Transcript_8901/g.15668 Transcript_8901/m.15668 type:complete len:102 (+) Transcript_8901:164-469(+)|eukprot:CAMPEP_0184522614 /NCGR_PEP_ID=MMETSP0198_2-20121128/8380_1 /TAXON_ID=1112570 /ORGANISM="Thraustochytrium sp., Strain LLF1b" /LENGTH=101 /DNA_ID=CAMNT_0026913461 /DNA_START=59 /DNA_END=364 /DNA_ORIENTATION=+
MGKADKDSEKPKRSLSAFMFFSKDARPKLVAENPDMSFGSVGKKIGEMWRQLSDDDRAPFQKQADADKERYKKAMENYSPVVTAKRTSKRSSRNKVDSDDE